MPLFRELDDHRTKSGKFQFIVVAEREGVDSYLLDDGREWPTDELPEEPDEDWQQDCAQPVFAAFEDDYARGYPKTFKRLEVAERIADAHEGARVVLWSHPEFGTEDCLSKV